MEDLSKKNTFPRFWNFTVNQSCTKVILPGQAMRVYIGSKDTALYMSQDGSIEGQTPPTHKGFIPKDNYFPLIMGRGSNRVNEIFICSQTGSAEVSLILMEE